MRLSTSTTRILAVGGMALVLLGSGIGRCRVEVTRVADLEGRDFLELDTWWWMVVLELGAAPIDMSDDVGARRSCAPGDIAPIDVAIIDLAFGALLDGVIGEGFAAGRLRRAARRSQRFAPVLDRLAREEAQHAQLGADIVAWCLVTEPAIHSTLIAKLDQLDSAPPSGGRIERLSTSEREAAGLCTSADATSAWADAAASADRLLAVSRAA